MPATTSPQTTVVAKFGRFFDSLSPEEQQVLSRMLSAALTTIGDTRTGADAVEGYLFSPISRAPGTVGGPTPAQPVRAPLGPPASSQVNGTANPTPGPTAQQLLSMLLAGLASDFPSF